MTDCERLGVFGGSFNPPTQAHLMLANHLLGHYVDRVIFLPVGDAYTKEDLIPASDRLAMLRLVVRDNPGFILSELETGLASPSKTYDSLVHLEEAFPTARLFFIMGSDQLEGLQRWHRIDDLLRKFTLLLLQRAEDDVEIRFQQDPWLSQRCSSFILCDNHPRSNLSSTMIRQRVAAGESIRYLTDPAIIAYIQGQSLYKSG
ncbi:MAG: nicotinate (nicotinamide) nucleotide adenylyltransferase [Symbiobacteriaceae bacterium]|nr:nicotinate (nicotinamide) nucleotide adenylyltransferase [Symbiobacteriaceae bacterium]